MDALERETVTFADLTTLRVGGKIDEVVYAHNTEELVAAVQDADQNHIPLLVVGGGSNIVPADEAFAGRVVVVQSPVTTEEINASCEIDSGDDADGVPPSCGGAILEHFAGVKWDDAVQFAVSNELLGIECLSGIPGTVGATPVQNVGAYGQEVASTIYRVRTWDRETQGFKTFAAADCAFGYRTSIFKRTPYRGPVASATGRYVVTSVTFQHRQGDTALPIAYPELARELGVEVGERAPLKEVRAAVLAIRERKAMVASATDHDSWSAGSFFTNPFVPDAIASTLPEGAPKFPGGLDADGNPLVKTSAAWLIQQAGFNPGFGLNKRATLSSRHTLALTNRGNASAADIRELAQHIRAGVEARFGIRLEVEPVQIGAAI